LPIQRILSGRHPFSKGTTVKRGKNRPLSVIKIGNQMIRKYEEMDIEEKLDVWFKAHQWLIIF